MFHQTKLYFSVIDTDCKHLTLLDGSYVNENVVVSGNTLQVILPTESEAVELTFQMGGITQLNSNNLGITNVTDIDYLTDLPDGLYIAKISICPRDQFWFEKTWYRTCILECNYRKAVIKLDLTSCDTCFSEQKAANIQKAWMYIEGVKANAEVGNYNKATELYNVANKIIGKILNCSDCDD